MGRGRACWLMKSEPGVFSIENLQAARNQTAGWDGVRNYQARNFLRDDVKPGDRVLFYHSSVVPPGIAGEAVVVREGYPDPTAWNPEHAQYDPNGSPENPIWYMVDVRFVRSCRFIPLDRLRQIPELKNMVLLRRGTRLSVQPVTAGEWRAIRGLPEWANAEIQAAGTDR
ncbi:EVE domain-containing protein [bacterium]|nr:EVE domain-containing protein [bacterium]